MRTNYREIKNEFLFINEFRKNSISCKSLPEFDFKVNFKENYTKMMYNIQFINLSKMQTIYLSEISSNLNTSLIERLHILEIIYEENLKSTVNEIMNFFKVENNNLPFDNKTMFQIYVYYLSPFNPERIKIEKLSSFNSEIRYSIANNTIYKLLKNCQPKDEIINFTDILMSII